MNDFLYTWETNAQHSIVVAEIKKRTYADVSP